MQQSPEALNLEQALRVLRRRLPLIGLCVVVVAGAAFAVSKHQPKRYTATASLSFSSNPLSQQIVGLQSSGGSLLQQQASNVELVRVGGETAASTAALLGDRLTAERVAESVSVSGQGESSVVSVSATAASPSLAAAIANTYAQQFVKNQQSANHAYFTSALALVEKQLAAMPRAQRLGADGLVLEQRGQTLRLLGGLNYGNAQVAGEAVPPGAPSSPKTSRNTVLGLFLGLLIGLALAFVLERVDRRIKSPEDLEATHGLPMLGIVPESAALARRRGKRAGASLPPAEAEAFNLIRAHLRFFNVDGDLHTLLVASAAQGDGKTTVAVHLAEAAACMGARVLLAEVDLRQPTLAQQLGINAGPGLTDVLVGSVNAQDAVQSFDPRAHNGTVVRALDVLVAGVTLPPNPAALIDSQRMRSVIEWAGSAYDLVVIDTPPLTAVSDAFPLLNSVDGVIIVGWVGRSRRDAAERLHRILASSRARLLGVVANGAKSGSPSVYSTRPPAPEVSSNGASSAAPREPSIRA